MKVLKSYMIVLFFVSLVIALIIYLSPNLPSGYYAMPLLPIVYSLVMMAFPKFHILASKYTGIKIVYVTMFFRYVIMPILIALSGNISVIGRLPLDKYILSGMLVMLWELVASVITIVFIGNRVLLKENTKFKISLNEENKSYFIYIILIAMCIALIFAYPTLIENFQFMKVSGESIKTISYFKGLDIRLLLVCKVVIYSLLIGKFSNLYKKKKYSIYYYSSLVLSIIYIGIMRGDNRTTLVVDIICVVVAMWHSFPSKRKQSVFLITAIGFILIVSVSIYRIFAPTSWRPEGNQIEINLAFFSRMFQSYLSGPNNMAFAIEMADIFKGEITFQTLFNDFFAWTGYFANYLGISSTSNITNNLFNIVIYSLSEWSGYGDKIIPMSGQGYSYFGYIGAPIFSVVTCVFIVYLDKSRYKSKSLDKLIIDTYLVSRLALFMGLSVTVIMMFLLDSYLQLWIIEKANSIFKVKLIKVRSMRNNIELSLEEKNQLRQ